MRYSPICGAGPLGEDWTHMTADTFFHDQGLSNEAQYNPNRYWGRYDYLITEMKRRPWLGH